VDETAVLLQQAGAESGRDERGTKVAGKEQFMGMVEADTLHRMDALRIVMGRSRARVNEEALLGGGLRGLERQQQARLGRLLEVAKRNGQSVQEFVKAYAAANSRKTYGPTLEELEREVGIGAEQESVPAG
jgi:hypothetical protein